MKTGSVSLEMSKTPENDAGTSDPGQFRSQKCLSGKGFLPSFALISANC